VDTDTPITSWIFIATEPEAAEGMVWIFTGTTAPVEFNALKKNGLQVCPIAAKQYISGAWVGKTAKIYQNGAWVDWFIYLYHRGDECTDITGRWIAQALRLTAATSDGTPTLTKESDRMRITSVAVKESGGIVRTLDKVDLSNSTTLKVDLNVLQKNTADWCWLIRIISDIGSTQRDNNVAEAQVHNLGRQTFTIDVSALEGSFYVAFGAYTVYADKLDIVDIYDVWLE
jgi:hypothetical protein